MPATYAVARYDMTGVLEVLGRYMTEQAADNAVDRFCAKTPGAFIDIFEIDADGELIF